MILGFILLLTGPDPAALLAREQVIARQFDARVHITSLPMPADPPAVHVDTTPMISYTDDAGVHEARFEELPPPMQATFNRWAGWTTDQPGGAALFDDMFHRFFFVHELGHWTTGRVIDARHDAAKPAAITNIRANHWGTELEVNRLAVAWWREQDPAFLAKLVTDFRRIQAHLRNPVPAGQDIHAFFAANYDALGKDPDAYGWFQLQFVIMAYDEPPRTFQQRLDELATYQYE